MLEALTTARKSTMRAVVCRRYGPPDALEIEEIEMPELSDDRVLVRVRASSVNPADYYSFKGGMARLFGSGILRPKSPLVGTDLAGTVEAVGKNVTQFRPGDEVFGARSGAFAEYANPMEDKLVLKPANVTFEQAAGVPIAALTALQALRDKGHVKTGQKVLINGAAGGVGTFAVQIAKAFGAEVTGVVSTKNVEQTRRLGADHVVDRTQEDFVKRGQLYDLVLDVAGDRSISDSRRVLVPEGTLVLVGAVLSMRGGFIGLALRLLKAKLMSKFTSKKSVFFIAKLTKEDLGVMKDLMESGKVTTVIDRSYPLDEVSEAFRYWERRHATGKIAIVV